jgi:hypothetical protein
MAVILAIESHDPGTVTIVVAFSRSCDSPNSWLAEAEFVLGSCDSVWPRPWSSGEGAPSDLGLVPSNSLRVLRPGVMRPSLVDHQPAGLIRRQRPRRLGPDVPLEALDGGTGQRSKDAVHRPSVISQATQRLLDLPPIGIRHVGLSRHRGRGSGRWRHCG